VREGDGVGAAVTRARAHVDEAMAALAALPPSPAGDTLAAAALHLVEGLDGGPAG
jgi:hypothetical protein